MKNTVHTKKKTDAVIITAIFVGLLFFVMLICILSPDREFSEMENRYLEPMPELSLETVVEGSFMEDFENYASDSFVLRDFCVKVAGNVEKLFGKKDNSKVYYGREGYLFAMDKIDEKQLEKNNTYVAEFIGKTKEEYPNMQFSVIVAPTASQVQGQYLPDFAAVPDEKAAMAQINQKLGEHFFDILPALEENSEGYIYYRTDHHWTTLGAWYGYKAWAQAYGIGERQLQEYTVEKVSDEFYGTNYSKAGISVKPDDMERFILNDAPEVKMTIGENLPSLDSKEKAFQSVYDESYLEVKDKYSYFLSGNNALTYINAKEGQNKDENQEERTLLVIKDSYAHCFIPFLTSDFDEIVAVDLRYYKGDMRELIEKYEITDVMLMYNIIEYSNDRNLVYLQQ